MTILGSASVEDGIPVISHEEFAERPPVLELSGIFCETDIAYTEDEYAAHLRETEAFAEKRCV